MSIEKKIDELIAALDRNTAAVSGKVVMSGKVVPPLFPKSPKSAPAAKDEPDAKDEPAPVTAEQVKAKINEVVKVKGVEVGRRLLDETRSGAKKFPDLKPEDYAVFVAKADMELAS